MNSFEYFFNNNDIKEGDVLELVLLTDDTKETNSKYLLKVNNKESFKDGLEDLIGNLNFVDNNEGDSVYMGNMLENTYLLRKAEVIEVGDKLKMTINIDKEKLSKMDCIELPSVNLAITFVPSGIVAQNLHGKVIDSEKLIATK